MINRLKDVYERISVTASLCGRNPESVKLVAVSKTISAERIKHAVNAGVRTFGENYIQEAQQKISVLSSDPLSWHFIGHLQTNKAKIAVELFDLIHSVDTVKLAKELDKQAKKINKVQAILIQSNISMEKTKSGIPASETAAMVKQISQFKNLSIKGLMTMPPFFNDPEGARPFFSALRDISRRIDQETISNVEMKELSMGMTGDYQVAIEEGATLVRIGTAIFGERH